MSAQQKLDILRAAEGSGLPIRQALERLDGVGSLGEARDALLEHFEAEADEVDRDVEAFINEVCEAGLIVEKK